MEYGVKVRIIVLLGFTHSPKVQPEDYFFLRDPTDSVFFFSLRAALLTA
jgi:hypothetical protein